MTSTTLTTRRLSLADIRNLYSTEGLLICGSCHVWYTDCDCKAFTPIGLVRVADVLPFKGGDRLRSVAQALRTGRDLPPLRIEHGVLLDGHHRVLAAELLRRDDLEVTDVDGYLDDLIMHNRAVTAGQVPPASTAPSLVRLAVETCAA